MSAEMTQLVELLGISQATAWPPSTEDVVIITVRPQPDNFRPHNIALKKAQAIRLLKDLESLLRALAMFLVAFSALVAAGCSARVEVERTKNTDVTAMATSSTEVSRTVVEVDFRNRSPQPVIQREPMARPVAPEPRPVTITNNTVVLSYRGGETHNETYIQVQEPVLRHAEETVVTRRPVHSVPPRPVDPRCERMAREHEERVRRWREFPLGE